MNIYVDTTNLYHTTRKRYSGQLNYESLINLLRDRYDIKRINFYVSRCGKKADPFIECLKHITKDLEAHFTIKEPHPVQMNGREVLTNNFNVELTVDALLSLEPVVICSADYNLLPLLEQLSDAIVYAINIPKVFRTVATCYEIEGSFVNGND